MRLDTASSKKDRYRLKPNSASALRASSATKVTKNVPIYLDIADVVRDVEKLRFWQNSQNCGDRKCLPKRRSSFVGPAIAKFFLRVFGEGVFQHPQAIALKLRLVSIRFASDGECNRDLSP